MSSIEELFDQEQLDRIWEAGEREAQFQWAKTRLLRAIADPPRLMEQPRSQLFFGRMVSGVFLAQAVSCWSLDIPFGWKQVRIPGRDAVRVMPIWIYWLTEGRWVWIRPLIRLGFMVGPDAGFHDFRPTLFFWRAQHFTERRYVLGQSLPWVRFAWWCGQKERGFWATMPQTATRMDVDRTFTEKMRALGVPPGITTARGILTYLEQRDQ